MSKKLDSMSLPEVAIIRKGDAKVVKNRPDGSTYESVGPDLKDHFRVVFSTGAEMYQKKFLEAYKTLKPTMIRAMVLSESVWDSWSWANEAYNAGRMIAKADDKHYLDKRNPLNGEYEVKNGEPFVPFTVGDVITYERDGKKYTIKPRTMGRLRLFLPDVGEWCQFILKTTSYYDRLNIDGQLNTVQIVANTLNGGNAAGIPLHIFRMEQEVLWNKPDGSGVRVKKWCVNLGPDPEWVRAATRRLSNFALTGEASNKLLAPIPLQIAGPVEPEQEEFDENPSESEIGEQQVVEGTVVEPEQPAKPTQPPSEYELALTVQVKWSDNSMKSLGSMTKTQLEAVVEKAKNKLTANAAALILEKKFNVPRPTTS